MHSGRGTSIKPFDESIKGIMSTVCCMWFDCRIPDNPQMALCFFEVMVEGIFQKLKNDVKIFGFPRWITRNSYRHIHIILTLTGCTHHFHCAEDVTEVVSTLQILGNVSKSAEVIRILGGARNVPDLMLRHYSLMEKGRK